MCKIHIPKALLTNPKNREALNFLVIYSLLYPYTLKGNATVKHV